MGKETELNAEVCKQIRKGRISENKSTDEYKMVERIRPLESYELDEYNGLTVTDVTDDEQYKFSSFDSGNRLVKTENGEFLIVHHRVVDTGAWSF